MDQTFMKTRKILPLVISMALPMAISMLVNSLYNIIDSYFVAKISEEAMTSLSLVYPVQNLITSVAVGFGIGINAAISYYLGAKDSKMADAAATEGLLHSLIQGFILSIVTIAVMPAFLRFFTENDTVINLALDYSRIAFLGAVIVSSQIALEKIFQAVGKMKVSMFAMMAGFITNIVLDPVFIFSFKMAIKGAAIATVIGQCVTLAIYIIVFKKEELGVSFDFSDMREKRKIVGRLYSVGIPGMLNMALPSVLITALNKILSIDAYVLILGSYYKLQTFLYLTVNGIVQGIRPIIGYNYGAKELKRVRAIFKTALVLSAIVMLMGTVLCQTFAGTLIGIFIKTPDIRDEGEAALRIISLGFIISSVSVISCGALEGLGKGLPSLIISCLRYVFIMIPLAAGFKVLFGVRGVWSAFPVTELILAIASFAIIRLSLNKADEKTKKYSCFENDKKLRSDNKGGKDQKQAKKPHRGRYNNDYSPKYSDPYDIYDKAKEHARTIKKRDKNTYQEEKN